MSGVTLRQEVNLLGWSAPLAEAADRARNLTPAHQEIGELLLDRATTNMGAGGSPGAPWPALSPATLIARAAGRSGTNQVFVDRVIEQESKAGTKSLLGKRLTQKAQKIIEGVKPLIWSGRLLRSLTWRATADWADVGSNLVYAARQFFGWMKTEPHTPARWPFGLTPGDEASIRDIYIRYLFGGIT